MANLRDAFETETDFEAITSALLTGTAAVSSDALATQASPVGELSLSPAQIPGDALIQSIITGTDGDDVLFGTADSDIINGLNGDDTLFGGAGDDTLTGGDGDDTLNGASGADIIDGGNGFDIASYRTSIAGVSIDLAAPSSTWTGVARGDMLRSIEEFDLSDVADVFRGNGQANVIKGFGGDDELFGFAGDDTVDGGAGNDILNGGSGDDALRGGDDNDNLNGASGADIVDGGNGFDIASYRTSIAGVSIDLAASSSTWTGVAQGDTLISIEELDLSDVADVFRGDAKANVVKGFDGDDQLFGFAGDDSLDGGAGNDSLDGGEGGDLLQGGAGADILNGGTGSDTVTYVDAASGVSIDLTRSSSTWTGDAQGDTLTSIETIQLTKFADIFRGDANANFANGGDGNDQMLGGGGDDTFTGDTGNDTIQGGDGNDFIVGDDFGNLVLAGDDFLQGNAGNDTLFGGGGNDKLVGGTGNDRLAGGLGTDFLIGNEGSDTFRYFSVADSFFDTANRVSQQDQIADFTQTEDKIDLSAIDANVALGGNQAFAFLADPADHTGDWTGLVWGVTDARGITTIFASNDGDADAEMQIFMSRGYTFTADDFIL